MKHYTIRFVAKRGAPMGVVEDMARYDAAKITATERDEACEPEHVRRATFVGRFPPTMARWASFWVGARLLPEPLIRPVDGMQPSGDAIEPRGRF